MYRTSLPLLFALFASTGAVAATCNLPSDLNERQFVNISDPLYQPDNPNAGRMVRVAFDRKGYVLEVLGTNVSIQGTYDYRLLDQGTGVIDMEEAHPQGSASYSLLMRCLTDRQGMFIFTQQDGPIAPAQRQNSGRWTLVP